jgi:ArsR family transcriptional regulator, arsenate/arsenite/antimonite-responsive transcriptional repressor
MPRNKSISKRQHSRIARVLAEPKRVEILEDIGAWKERRVPYSALVKMLDISPATLSYHIKEIESAGLLEVSRRGRYIDLVLNREALRNYAEHLMEI